MKNLATLLLPALIFLGCNQISGEPTAQQCMAWKSSANDKERSIRASIAFLNPPHPERLGGAGRIYIEKKVGVRVIQQCVDLGYW
jgi:hypothetical protein